MKRSAPSATLVAAIAAALTRPTRLIRCAASRDGECAHRDCPQLRDNEPGKTGRHCPLDVSEDE